MTTPIAQQVFDRLAAAASCAEHGLRRLINEIMVSQQQITHQHNLHKSKIFTNHPLAQIHVTRKMHSDDHDFYLSTMCADMDGVRVARDARLHRQRATATPPSWDSRQVGQGVMLEKLDLKEAHKRTHIQTHTKLHTSANTRTHTYAYTYTDTRTL